MSRLKPSDAIRTSLLAVIQTAVGCGIGLLLAGKLRRPTQKVTAATLFSVGALLAVPGIVGFVLRAWYRPTSARGARRRLDTIRRDSGFPDEAEVF
jgi:ABC-type spermidine/putrescine transport system permease subunit II